MATISESRPGQRLENSAVVFLRRAWRFVWPPVVDSPVAESDAVANLTFMGRVRKFLWVSSGLFSAASFAIPAIGLVAFGTVDGMANDFLAAIVSACLFGIACLLHFGPDEA